MLRRAKERFKELRKGFETDSYGWLVEVELNNALIAAYRTYHGALPLIEELHKALGGDLKQTVTFLKRALHSRHPREMIRSSSGHWSAEE